MHTVRRALVFVGGDPPSEAVARHLPADALGIGADSGIDTAATLGFPIHLAIGDFDSVTVGGLEAAATAGVELERHDPDKDATDLELGLDAALRRGVEHVTVVGGDGGRLDHLLGNLLVIAAPKYAPMRVDAWYGPAFVAVVRDALRVEGVPGRMISLLAVHGPASGVRTRGLRFGLRGETLPEGGTRGLSNEIVSDRAEIALTGGTLLVVCHSAVFDPPVPTDTYPDTDPRRRSRPRSED